jgi:F-type H+-transporting ATPase subunit epsilon
MQLRVVVPTGPFACVDDVTRVVAMTPAGTFGLLPHRQDCATALSPGLLTYSTTAAGEVHLAVDAGVMVKTGAEVCVCVRHAVAGVDLGGLREAVEQELQQLSDQERSSRTRLARLEIGLIRHLVDLQRA